ncbi:MAG: hypothetical protein AAF530_19830 [Pseudomonadota bacterium]
MNIFFPVLGAIACWFGLDHLGPPLIQGQWNFPSAGLWLVFAAFVIRLSLALLDIVPDAETDNNETSSKAS